MGILKAFRQGLHEFSTLLKGFWWPHFEMNMPETFYQVLVFGIEIFRNLP